MTLSIRDLVETLQFHPVGRVFTETHRVYIKVNIVTRHKASQILSHGSRLATRGNRIDTSIRAIPLKRRVTIEAAQDGSCPISEHGCHSARIGDFLLHFVLVPVDTRI